MKINNLIPQNTIKKQSSVKKTDGTSINYFNKKQTNQKKVLILIKFLGKTGKHQIPQRGNHRNQESCEQ